MGTKDFLFTLIGHPAGGAQILATGIRVIGGTPMELPFLSFAGARAESWLAVFARLRLLQEDGAFVEIVGIGRDEAELFAREAELAWKTHARGLFDTKANDIQAAARMIWALRAPGRYPAACLVDPVLTDARKAVQGLPRRFPKGVLTDGEINALNLIGSFLKDPAGHRDRAVKAFVKAELESAKDLFDTVERLPLTPEQRLAVVTDEDATLVLAGAGSGKTSVIVAKAAHLVTRRFRRSGEVLLMSFASKAAKEMADRVKDRTGLPVDARTFHSLGRMIIERVEGGPPNLAPHAGEKDGDAKFKQLVKDIVGTLIAADEEFGDLMRRWFGEFFAPYRSLWDFTSLSEYLHYVRSHELRTLKGEKVRSFEECEIANWLFLNGVGYEYEPKYEHEVSSPGRRAYRPDFRLTESGVYIEHFGVSKETAPDGSVRLRAAPFMDNDRYLADRQWKREVHAKHHTVLLETFSYEKAEGTLTANLAKKIAPYAKPKPIPAETMFDQLREVGALDPFTDVVCTFLKHFKGNGLTIEDCLAKIDDSRARPRHEAFLSVFTRVFSEYQKALGERIDFEDMITKATGYVEDGSYRSPYRHLLVDEFQDISLGRSKLLRALLDQHSDARLFAVGDDWQAIFRFAGSDLAIMRESTSFGGTFAGKDGIHATVDLGRTFRCVDKVALPAKRFVRKNPLQLDKAVAPAGTTDEVAIRVTYALKGAEHAALKDILARLQEASAAAGIEAKVTVLSRYTALKPQNLPLLNKEYPSLKLNALTAHSSKGLEADHVVVVGMNSGRMGFPCEIVDDPVLMMVLPEKEPFRHAEERRLFYVALTRAKRSVDLIAESERPSTFVDELVAEAEYGVEVVGEAPGQPGGCPRCGGRMIRKPTKSGDGIRFVCEHGNYCGYSAPPCPNCGVDAPTRRAGSPAHLVCSCGHRYPICTECGDGWLLQRPGPNNSTFLGCSNFPQCRGSRNVRPAGAARRRRG